MCILDSKCLCTWRSISFAGFGKVSALPIMGYVFYALVCIWSPSSVQWTLRFDLLIIICQNFWKF
jgi:hypothetical protein